MGFLKKFEVTVVSVNLNPKNNSYKKEQKINLKNTFILYIKLRCCKNFYS